MESRKKSRAVSSPGSGNEGRVSKGWVETTRTPGEQATGGGGDGEGAETCQRSRKQGRGEVPSAGQHAKSELVGDSGNS